MASVTFIPNIVRVYSALLQEVQSAAMTCKTACVIVKVTQHRGWQVAWRDDEDMIFIQNHEISVAARHPASPLFVKPATESSRKNTGPTHPLELHTPIPTTRTPHRQPYPLRRPGFVAVGARRPIPLLSSSRLVASIITPPPFAFTLAPSSPTPHEASVPSLQSTARPALRMLISGSIKRQAQLELEPGRGRARSRQP
jgi:hypothetical protein